MSIETILTELYTNVKPGIVVEAESYCAQHGVNDAEFQAALTSYRMKSGNSRRFCPTIWDLVPYLPKRAQQPQRCLGDLNAFISEIEYFGWRRALQLAFRQDGRFAEFLRMMGIDEQTPPYAEHLWLPEDFRWLAEYWRLIHVELNLIAAYRYAIKHANEKARLCYRRRLAWLETTDPAEHWRHHEYLRHYRAGRIDRWARLPTMPANHQANEVPF